MHYIIKKEGFDYAFDFSKCYECGGSCCIGKSGYVWLNPKEIENIAKFLNIDIEEFKKNFLRKIGYKFSLKEIKRDNSYECIFFDRAKKGCLIYSVRPYQCRTFPFWDHFKSNIDEVINECIGVVFL